MEDYNKRWEDTGEKLAAALACAEGRKSPIWTVLLQWPWGHIYLHVFLQLLPICFFESLVDSKLVESGSEVSDLFLYTIAFQIHITDFFSVSCAVCNLYSKCLLRQYIPLDQQCILKFLWDGLSSATHCQRDFLMASRNLFSRLHDFL